MSVEELANKTDELTTYSMAMSPALKLPGAEFQSGIFENRPASETIFDDPSIETGLFHTQDDYNIYLKSQGLGLGGNHSSIGMFAPVAPGQVSEEDQKYIDQAFKTADPVIDKGDGWYSMVYSGDGNNAKDSARVYPCDFKMNENDSIGIRGDSPEVYAHFDKFKGWRATDPYDFEQWKEENAVNHPEWTNDNNIYTGLPSQMMQYAEDAAATRREIETYPDRRDPSQINQTLLHGMEEKEAAKTASLENTGSENQVTGTLNKETSQLAQTANVANTELFKSIGLAGFGKEIMQVFKQLLDKMNEYFSSNKSEAFEKNATAEYQVADAQRDKVDMSTVNASYQPQAQSGYGIA